MLTTHGEKLYTKHFHLSVIENLNIAIAEEDNVLEKLDMIQLRNNYLERIILEGSE